MYDTVGALRIEIRDAEAGGKPEWVQVFIRSDSLLPVGQPNANSELRGYVQLDNLDPGTYWITLRRIGYMSKRYRVEVSSREMRTVRIAIRATFCTFSGDATQRKPQPAR